MAFLADEYRTEMQEKFDALLCAAEERNLLYYLLHLFNLWGLHGPIGAREHGLSMDFNSEINRMTTSLILDKVRHGQVEPILPQDILFVFQANIEQKGFYAGLRNFISIASDADCRQEPWRDDEWREHSKLSTAKIIRNIHNELTQAGFTELAKEFQATHLEKAKSIRNGIAHGNFRIPHTETNDMWVFGDYERTTSGYFTIETTRFTGEDFRDVFLRLLCFRLAFFAAVGAHREKYDKREFDFEATNQKNRGEVLQCRFENRGVIVKYKGTPLW